MTILDLLSEAVNLRLQSQGEFIRHFLLVLHLVDDDASQFHLNRVCLLQNESGNCEVLRDYDLLEIVLLNFNGQGSDDADSDAQDHL